MIKKGFDIINQLCNMSEQTVTDYQLTVIRCGYRGCIDGKIYADIQFPQYIEQLTNPSSFSGIYFFSQAIHEEEVLEEADWVLQTIASCPKLLPICYCCDGLGENRMKHTSLQDFLRFYKIFSNHMQQQNYLTVLGLCKNILPPKAELLPILRAKYKLWILE